MEEKDLILKLKQLRRIRPDKKWVILTKKRILGKERRTFLSLFNPVLAGVFLTLFLVFIGLFLLSQKALPGESLYLIKKITEEAKTIFVSQEEKPKLELEMAAKRLEELRQIAEKNDIRKLSPAIKEVKETSSRAAKSLKEIKKLDQALVATTKEISENKILAQKILESEIETPELNEAYKDLADNLIKDLEKSSLTEKQREIFQQAKEFFEKGDYLSAFLKAIEVSQMR